MAIIMIIIMIITISILIIVIIIINSIIMVITWCQAMINTLCGPLMLVVFWSLLDEEDSTTGLKILGQLMN